MELMERSVRGVINGEPVGKKVKEILSEEDVWVSQSGQTILKHEGVLKLAEFVGAFWDIPRLDDTPTHLNDKGFYYLITCQFPDGSNSFESGEASDFNTEKGSISHKYKQSIALKRGMDRSFLRSSYMKMYDVYSAEEADVFKGDRLKMLENENTQLRDQLLAKNKMLMQLTEYMNLPADDTKYPGIRVMDVWNLHKDIEYIKSLTEHSDEVIAWMGKGLLARIERAKLKELTPATPEETNENKVTV